MEQTISENEEVSLIDYLPYLHIEDRKIFMKDLSSIVGYKLKPFYDELKSNKEIVENEKSLQNFLNSLTEDIYCQYIFKKNQNLDNIIEEHKKLNKSDNPTIKNSFNKRVDRVKEEIKEKELFNYEHYLFLKKNFDLDISKPKNILYTDKKLNNKTKRELDNINKEMDNIAKEYKGYLEGAKRLNDNELAEIISQQINFEKKDIDYKHNTDLVNTDIKINKDNLYINGKYARIITFKANREPEKVNPKSIKYLLGFKDKRNLKLNFEYDLVVNFRMLNKQEQKGKLENQRSWARTNKKKPSWFGGGVKKEIEKKEKDLDKLLEKLTSGKENIFKTEILIVVKANSKDKLKENTDQMVKNIRQMEGSDGYKESFANFKLYKNTLAGNCNLANHRNFKFRTSYFVDLLPVFGSIKGEGKPLMLFRNKYDSITYFNPINNKYKKKNAIVVGATGSGKSFVMNMINLNLLAFDPVITIIDKGGSYKKFVELFGGDHFEVSFDDKGQSNYRINPFDVDIVKDKDIYYSTLIQRMVKEKGQDITNNDKIIIEESISALLNKDIDNPIISDFVREIGNLEFNNQKLKNTRDKIERHLSRWTRGRRGNLFNNRKGNLDVSNDILSIDLDGLNDYDEILEVFMYYITAICRNKANKANTQIKQFVFDEVWELFLTEQGGELIREFYRTIRKKGGSLYSISQSISDFADSDYAPDILENISMYYILEQSDGADFEKLKRTLNLTDKMIEKIRLLSGEKGEYSEMFIKTPFNKFVGRMIPSSYEYWLATTDSNDIVKLNEMQEKKKSLNEVVEYLSKTYPKGV